METKAGGSGARETPAKNSVVFCTESICLEVKRVNLCYCSNLVVLKLVDVVDVKESWCRTSVWWTLKSLAQSCLVDTPIDLHGLGLLRDLCSLILIKQFKVCQRDSILGRSPGLGVEFLGRWIYDQTFSLKCGCT